MREGDFPFPSCGNLRPTRLSRSETLTRWQSPPGSDGWCCHLRPDRQWRPRPAYSVHGRCFGCTCDSFLSICVVGANRKNGGDRQRHGIPAETKKRQLLQFHAKAGASSIKFCDIEKPRRLRFWDKLLLPRNLTLWGSRGPVYRGCTPVVKSNLGCSCSIKVGCMAVAWEILGCTMGDAASYSLPPCPHVLSSAEALYHIKGVHNLRSKSTSKKPDQSAP